MQPNKESHGFGTLVITRDTVDAFVGHVPVGMCGIIIRWDSERNVLVRYANGLEISTWPAWLDVLSAIPPQKEV